MDTGVASLSLSPTMMARENDRLYECGYKDFGIMFIDQNLSKKKKQSIEALVRFYDGKIKKFIEQQHKNFDHELDLIGFENVMGVIREKKE